MKPTKASSVRAGSSSAAVKAAAKPARTKYRQRRSPSYEIRTSAYKATAALTARRYVIIEHDGKRR